MSIYTPTQLKNRITTYIKQNFLRLITGPVLQSVLIDVVDSIQSWIGSDPRVDDILETTEQIIHLTSQNSWDPNMEHTQNGWGLNVNVQPSRVPFIAYISTDGTNYTLLSEDSMNLSYSRYMYEYLSNNLTIAYNFCLTHITFGYYNGSDPIPENFDLYVKLVRRTFLQ